VNAKLRGQTSDILRAVDGVESGR